MTRHFWVKRLLFKSIDYLNKSGFVCMTLHRKMFRPGMIISSMLWFAYDDSILCREIENTKENSFNMLMGLWLQSLTKCKNNYHTWLYYCIYTCWFPKKLFGSVNA